MINRVLIRIKVVQMLYSYLLTRSEFKINTAPEAASRDKKYAYQIYIDMLLLLIELSGYSVTAGQKPPVLYINKKLEGNKVAKALLANDVIKAAIARGESKVRDFDLILQKLADKIAASKVFIDMAKKHKIELGDEVVMWTAIFETVFNTDPDIIGILRSKGDYSSQGYLWGIRDVCMTLRAYADARALYQNAKADLDKSLDKAYELYIRLFALILDITDEQERRIEAAKSKHLATSADLNPNIKLINNQLAAYLRDNESLADLLKEYKVARPENTTPLVRSLLDQLLASDLYKNYIESEEKGLQHDAEFWREAFKTIILPSDALAEELEDKSVYWNDDLQIMGTFMLKTLRQIAQSNGEEVALLPKYKDLDDANFGPDLFAYTIKNQEEYRGYIEMFVSRSQWDPDRLAYMDIVILTAAIAEIINYPSIPVPVSVNEYVEIANDYSSEKSGAFINGILSSIIGYLNEQGIINKK